MSDERREAAVQRLERFTRIRGADARRVVDMVIAAIEDGISDAAPGPPPFEPSEAEIVAALNTYADAKSLTIWGDEWDRSHDAMRRALIAARNAGEGVIE